MAGTHPVRTKLSPRALHPFISPDPWYPPLGPSRNMNPCVASSGRPKVDQEEDEHCYVASPDLLGPHLVVPSQRKPTTNGRGLGPGRPHPRDSGHVSADSRANTTGRCRHPSSYACDSRDNLNENRCRRDCPINAGKHQTEGPHQTGRSARDTTHLPRDIAQKSAKARGTLF